MTKRIVYIAHPISGDIDGNLKDITRILRIINLNIHPNKISGVGYPHFNFGNIVPLAPYFADIIALDDTKPLERKRGIENDIALINTGVFDEIWLTGNKISFGMHEEIKLFILLGKPVVNYIGKL